MDNTEFYPQCWDIFVSYSAPFSIGSVLNYRFLLILSSILVAVIVTVLLLKNNLSITWVVFWTPEGKVFQTLWPASLRERRHGRRDCYASVARSCVQNATENKWPVKRKQRTEKENHAASCWDLAQFPRVRKLVRWRVWKSITCLVIYAAMFSQLWRVVGPQVRHVLEAKPLVRCGLDPEHSSIGAQSPDQSDLPASSLVSVTLPRSVNEFL